jgi:hypothetical protein
MFKYFPKLLLEALCCIALKPKLECPSTLVFDALIATYEVDEELTLIPPP